jgi:hypothetical protein
MKPARIHYCAQNSPQLDSVINTMSGVYIFLQYISKIPFNIILQPKPISKDIIPIHFF